MVRNLRWARSQAGLSLGKRHVVFLLSQLALYKLQRRDALSGPATSLEDGMKRRQVTRRTYPLMSLLAEAAKAPMRIPQIKKSTKPMPIQNQRARGISGIRGNFSGSSALTLSISAARNHAARAVRPSRFFSRVTK